MKKEICYSIMFLLLLSMGSCIQTDFCKKLKIKHAGTYNKIETDDNRPLNDYYYVYGFQEGKICYQKIRSYLDSLVIDTTRDHYITFMKYDTTLPDTTEDHARNRMSSGRFFEAWLVKYSYQKDSHIKNSISYYNDGEQKESIFW